MPTGEVAAEQGMQHVLKGFAGVAGVAEAHARAAIPITASTENFISHDFEMKALKVGSLSEMPISAD